MTQRKVIVYKWKSAGGADWDEKILIGEGVFHGFGVGHKRYDEGVGAHSTVIVEMPDGEILNVVFELARFIK